MLGAALAAATENDTKYHSALATATENDDQFRSDDPPRGQIATRKDEGMGDHTRLKQPRSVGTGAEATVQTKQQQKKTSKKPSKKNAAPPPHFADRETAFATLDKPQAFDLSADREESEGRLSAWYEACPASLLREYVREY